MVQFNFNDSNKFGGMGKMGGKPAASSRVKFSPKDVISFFSRYKAELICVGVVLVTSIGIWQFVRGQMAKINMLDRDLQVLSEKEGPVVGIKKVMQEDASLFSKVAAPLLENKFIPYLASLADKRSVTISAMTPPEVRDAGFFYRSAVQMTCSASSFQDALLFLNDIERSEYALKVESWKARSLSTPDRPLDNQKAEANGASKIEITIVVSSIEILGNEKNQRKK